MGDFDLNFNALDSYLNQLGHGADRQLGEFGKWLDGYLSNLWRNPKPRAPKPVPLEVRLAVEAMNELKPYVLPTWRTESGHPVFRQLGEAVKKGGLVETVVPWRPRAGMVLHRDAAAAARNADLGDTPHSQVAFGRFKAVPELKVLFSDLPVTALRSEREAKIQAYGGEASLLGKLVASAYGAPDGGLPSQFALKEENVRDGDGGWRTRYTLTDSAPRRILGLHLPPKTMTTFDSPTRFLEADPDGEFNRREAMKHCLNFVDREVPGTLLPERLALTQDQVASPEFKAALKEVRYGIHAAAVEGPGGPFTALAVLDAAAVTQIGSSTLAAELAGRPDLAERLAAAGSDGGSARQGRPGEGLITLNRDIDPGVQGFQPGLPADPEATKPEVELSAGPVGLPIRDGRKSNPEARPEAEPDSEAPMNMNVHAPAYAAGETKAPVDTRTALAHAKEEERKHHPPVDPVQAAPVVVAAATAYEVVKEEGEDPRPHHHNQSEVGVESEFEPQPDIGGEAEEVVEDADDEDSSGAASEVGDNAPDLAEAEIAKSEAAPEAALPESEPHDPAPEAVEPTPEPEERSEAADEPSVLEPAAEPVAEPTPDSVPVEAEPESEVSQPTAEDGFAPSDEPPTEAALPESEPSAVQASDEVAQPSVEPEPPTPSEVVEPPPEAEPVAEAAAAEPVAEAVRAEADPTEGVDVEPADPQSVEAEEANPVEPVEEPTPASVPDEAAPESEGSQPVAEVEPAPSDKSPSPAAEPAAADPEAAEPGVVLGEASEPQSPEAAVEAEPVELAPEANPAELDQASEVEPPTPLVTEPEADLSTEPAPDPAPSIEPAGPGTEAVEEAAEPKAETAQVEAEPQGPDSAEQLSMAQVFVDNPAHEAVIEAEDPQPSAETEKTVEPASPGQAPEGDSVGVEPAVNEAEPAPMTEPASGLSPVTAEMVELSRQQLESYQQFEEAMAMECGVSVDQSTPYLR